MHGNVGAARNGAGLVDFRCMHLGRLLGVGMTVALTSALLVGPNALGASLPTGFDQQTLASGLTRPPGGPWAPRAPPSVAGRGGAARGPRRGRPTVACSSPARTARSMWSAPTER